MSEQSLKDKTAKGLFWGGLSNIVQQLLTLLFGIFLARILSREDYGLVGMLSIFSLLAGSLQESGFTMALANKKVVKHADYNAVFWFSILVGSVLYAILFFCAPLIARFYDTPVLTSLARYSFLGFLISSFGTAQNAYLFRHLMVKQRAMCIFIALVVSGSVGVVLAWNGFAYWGIVTQNIIYVGVTTSLYWYFSPWRPAWRLDFRPLKGMIAFSSRMLFTNMFIYINNNVLSVILGKFYAVQQVGDYNQAAKWNGMGYSVVNGMVNGVAQPVLANVADDRERQKRVFRKMLRFTAFVAFPALFGLSMVAPELITIAITDKWAASSRILQVLCIGSPFICINTLYANLVISKGKSQIYMWSTIGLGVLQIAVMMFSYPYGIPAMIRLYVGINILWLLVWQYFVWKEIGLTLWEALKDIVPFAGVAAATMLGTAYVLAGVANIYLAFVAKVAMAASVYGLAMWGSRSVTFRESLHYLSKKAKRGGASG